MKANSAALYGIAVLIWGSTWFAVTFQIGNVAAEASVAYRFALAGLTLLAFAALRGVRLGYPLGLHARMALQGALLAATFLCVYLATGYIASGLVAVVFSLAVFLNLIGDRIAFGTRVQAGPLAGAVLGVLGVLLVFLPVAGPIRWGSDALTGFALAGAAALFGSLTNIAADANQRDDIAVLPLNAYGMLYAAICITLYATASGKPFTFEWSGAYVISLLYLAIFGSALVFGVYLELIRREGVSRAGYIAVAVPVVALAISSAFEDLRWMPVMLLGLAACVAGNILALRRPATIPGAPQHQITIR